MSGHLSIDPTLYRFTGDGAFMLASRSDATGDTFWPRRLRCPITGGTVHDVEVAATGTIWSWTFVHSPWPGEAAPTEGGGYAPALVDLDGNGPRVIGILLGSPPWRVGGRVIGHPLTFRTADGRPEAVLAFAAEDWS